MSRASSATEWAIHNYNHILPFHMSNNIIDEVDYDAIGADVILQKIVLGEVVYG